MDNYVPTDDDATECTSIVSAQSSSNKEEGEIKMLMKNDEYMFVISLTESLCQKNVQFILQYLKKK